MTECGSPRTIGGVNCLANTPVAPWARLVLAHGAGAPMDSEFMVHIADLLRELGLEVIRFEFPYMAARRATGTRRPPDRQPILLDTWRSLIDGLADDQLPLAIGGKSMGGRMASLVADEYRQTVRALICLGYPFHPPGKPEKTRTDHLKQLAVPTLILQGSRDPMGKPEEVAQYQLAPSIEVHWLDTADHDLKPLRRSGHTAEDYLARAAEHSARFIASQISVNRP